MKNKGFTLIEVLVALFILTGAIMVIASAWSGNFLRLKKSAMLNDVSTLLEKKMLEVEARYKNRSLTEIPDEDAGDFGSDYPRYSWKMKSRELKLPDLTPVLAAQEGGAPDELIAMVKQTTEFLGQSIKELQVTIVVKGRSGKDLQFSATQYMIDYSREFGGGGLSAPAGGVGGSGSSATPAPTPGRTGP